MSSITEKFFVPDTELAVRLANRMVHDLREVQKDCEKCMREVFHLTDRQIELLREGKQININRGSHDKNSN